MQVRSGGKFKQASHQGAFVASLIVLLAIFIGIANFAFFAEDGDNLIDDDLLDVNLLSPVWVISRVYPAFLSSYALIAIFAQFVGYKGGRSSQKYFNDRTIDMVNPILVIPFDGSRILRPSIFLIISLQKSEVWHIHTDFLDTNGYFRRR